MINDAKKLLNIMTEENLNKILSEFGIDFEDIAVNPSLYFNQIKDLIYKKYFSEFDKYIGNEEFFDNLSLDSEDSYVLAYSKMFFSDDFYNFLNEYALKTLSKEEIRTIIFTKDDFDYFISKGFDLDTILTNFAVLPDVHYDIFMEYPEYIDRIMEKEGASNVKLIATVLSLGKKKYLSDYFNSYGDFDKKIIDILKESVSFDNIDFEFLFDSLLSKFIGRGDMSLIEDEEIVKKLIDKIGSKALIFAKNPSADLVNYTDFTYNDYTIYDGSYKNSSALLEKFLKAGKTDALVHAKRGAISKEVVELIKSLNIPVESFEKNYELSSSFELVKFFVEKGNYIYVRTMKDILSNSEVFDYVYSLYSKSLLNYTDFYSNSDDFGFFLGLVANDWSRFRNYQIPLITEEIAKKVLDLGFNVDMFLQHLTEYEHRDVFISLFAEREDYIAVLFAKDKKLYDKYESNVTYSLFNSLDEARKQNVNHNVYYKLIKEGHYDVLKNIRYISDYDIRMSGLNTLSYDDYLKLPLEIQNIPILKEKFLQYDSSSLIDLLHSNPTPIIIEKVALGGMPYDELLSHLKSSFSLTNNTILYYLKKGHIDVLDHLGFLYDSKFCTELADLCYEILNGAVPPEKIVSSSLRSYLLKKYIPNKKFEILNYVDYFSDEDVKLLVENGFNLDSLKKYPVCHYNVLKHFVSKENEELLVNILLSSNYSHFSNINELFLQMYRAQYSIENLQKVQSKFYIDFEKIFTLIDDNEFDIFTHFSISSLIRNKVLMDKLLGYLDVNKIREAFSEYGFDNESKLFVIRKMVERGCYDFVSYYTDKVEESVLKRSLLGGYFPVSQLKNNEYFKKMFFNLRFSLEEKKYLMENIKKNPMFILLFPEMMDDKKLISRCVIEDYNFWNLLPDKYKHDYELIDIVLKTIPDKCEFILPYDIDAANLANLLIDNKELIKYLPNRFWNQEVIKLVIPENPNVIDYYQSSLSSDIVLDAFNSGYIFSDKTKPYIVLIALENDIDLNYDFLKSLGSVEIISLASKLIDVNDEKKQILFEKLFKDFINEDTYSFIYDYLLFRRNNWYITSAFNDFVEKLGLDLSKFHNYSLDSKEQFLLMAKLDELPKDDSALEILDKMLNEGYDPYTILSWIDNNLNSELSIVKKNEIAKKYFNQSPLSYVKFVDCTDSEIINYAREKILDYPNLYNYFPTILDNKELILKLIDLTNGDVYRVLEYKFLNDVEILEAALNKNNTLIQYIDSANLDVIKFAKDNLFKYPFIISVVNGLVTDKTIAIKLLDHNEGTLYNHFPFEYKIDYDVCLKYATLNDYNIFNLSIDTPRYKELVVKHLEKFGFNIIRFKNLINIDKDIAIAAVKSYPNALFEIPLELFTDEVLAYADDFSNINLQNATVEQIMKIIYSAKFNANDFPICCNFIKNLLRKDILTNLDKNDPVIKKIFSNGISSANDTLMMDNPEIFRNVLEALSYLDITMFDSNIQKIFNDSLVILASTGKLNTLEKNRIFNYKVVKYIYPLFGTKFVLDLIKYNTNASDVILKHVTSNNGNLLVNYYNLILNNNVFPNDDKLVHFAFRYFDSFEILIKDIINNNYVLNTEDVSNLRKIIMNDNKFCIIGYNDLKKYDFKTKEYWNTLMNSDDINSIKNGLASIFGYNALADLKNEFISFQLDNFVNLKYLRNDIIKQYGEEKSKEIFDECFYSKKDIALITLMSRVINSSDICELKELMVSMVQRNNETLDYCDDVREIIRKTRLLHNYQFNGRLTRISDIKSPRLDATDPNNNYGVTIIDMDSEKFNFLAHRIYSYDSTMSGFKERLMKEPELWTKLEGASTLSTSSISDKGFWCIDAYNNDGVVYLFNDLPKEFMLFMNGRDLYVEHGGYKLEPTAHKNSFTNLDAINQASGFANRSYNEVAGFREGMMPCAIACLGDKPNEDQIRAAQYFNIPIIRFNVRAYDDKKQVDYDKAKNDFKSNPTYESMYNIFFNGFRVTDAQKAIQDHIEYCMTILREKYISEQIDFSYLLKSLAEMESIVSQIIVDLPQCKKDLAKIGIYRKSLTILNNCSKEEIISLESAAMGESGIMYKLSEGEKTYLVKPSVEKASFVTQAFRADIQEAASQLQKFLSPNTAVNVESFGGNMRLAKQELVEVSSSNSKLLEDWVSKGGPLDYQYSSALLKEYVVDFLLCNFDCFVGNFIIDSNDNVRGIDKEQSFRFIDDTRSLKADFSFTPNGTSRIPIYQYLFKRFKNGEIDLDLSVISDTIEQVSMLSDEEYKGIFAAYAKRLNPKKADELLDAILRRRDLAIQNMEKYVEELQKYKKTEGISL